MGGSQAYCYASKSARGHVLQQRKIRRQSFIAVDAKSVIGRNRGNRELGNFLHILVLFYWLCVWLGHWRGHGHRSSSVRLRLQSQDVDCLDNTGADRRLLEGACWGSGGRYRRKGTATWSWSEQVAGARLDFFRGLVNGDDECLENRFGSDRGH